MAIRKAVSQPKRVQVVAKSAVAMTSAERKLPLRPVGAERGG